MSPPSAAQILRPTTPTSRLDIWFAPWWPEKRSVARTQAHNGRSGASKQSIELLNTYHGLFDLRGHAFCFAFRVSFSLQCLQRVEFAVLDVYETTGFIAIDPS